MNDAMKPSGHYDAYMTTINLIETLLGGTPAMRDAAEQYLPKEQKEAQKSYENRLMRTILFNGFRRTVSYLTGQVFTKPPVVTDVDGLAITADVNLQGDNLTVFAGRTFSKGVSFGVTHILVDMPTTIARTVEDEERLRIRPYFVNVPPQNLIGWKVGPNGQYTQVRIQETIIEDDGEYDTTEVKQVRVLEPGKWKIYRKNAENETYLFNEGTTSLDYVPLVTFMPGTPKTKVTACPPLDDLAYLNLTHWQSSSDQRNILHVARVPLLFGRNLGKNAEGEVTISVAGMFTSDEDNSELKYVEHSGKAIEAGRQDLIDLEHKMALYGLQMLMPNTTGTTTATERALDAAESDSTLKSWALMLADTLTTAYHMAADYMSLELPDDFKISLNTDYRSVIQDTEPKILIEAAQSNMISYKLVFDELQRRGIIAENTSWDDDQAIIEEQLRGSVGSLLSDLGAGGVI